MKIIELSNIGLKRCPFCGGKAKLVRKSIGCLLVPSATITDRWAVECKSGCINTKSYADNIYHDSEGRIVIEVNGAEMAISEWNKRMGG